VLGLAAVLCGVLMAACSLQTSSQPGSTARAAPREDRKGATPHRSNLPRLPAGWPKVFELGMADPPGGAAELAAAGGFGIRYQYLSGGVNTGEGWQQWSPEGTFVDRYVSESLASGMLPVFSYYMLLQSAPGNANPSASEQEKDLINLAAPGTMRAYFLDLEAFLRRAGKFAPHPVVLDVEPDLWGYMQQAAQQDDASSVPAQVAGTGLPELQGLPNDASGVARAIVRLRNALAPNVLLGYHLSVFGTGKDLLHEKPPPAVVDELAARSAAFYHSLGARFDLIFSEFSNRNAGYSEVVLHDHGASWWGPEDYARNLRYLADVVRMTRRRVVIWQIPVGNTRMRAMDNTKFHYQDNHVQWLLADHGERHLREYMRAGVIALLFGPALPGDTCACDAAGDGVTNPAPINGNTVRSFSADDDGGFLRARARRYVRLGPLRLPR
jgi:hypothetical protein